MQGVGIVCVECDFPASEEHKAGSRRSGKCGHVYSPFLNCSRSAHQRGQRTLSFRLWDISVT